MPDLTDDLELIPPADTALSAEVQLDLAAQEALEDPLSEEEEGSDDFTIPFGRTWAFDFVTRTFIRSGTAPAEVRGQAALQQWILTALHTARGAHASCPDEFGMEDVDDWIGDVDPLEAMADFEARLRDALLVHDRIAEIDDFEYELSPADGVIFIRSLVIITDEEEAVPLLDVEITPEV